MCDCCDHPLQHVIRHAIARYEAPIPPPTAREIIADLKDQLQMWEDDQ